MCLHKAPIRQPIFYVKNFQIPISASLWCSKMPAWHYNWHSLHYYPCLRQALKILNINANNILRDENEREWEGLIFPHQAPCYLVNISSKLVVISFRFFIWKFFSQEFFINLKERGRVHFSPRIFLKNLQIPSHQRAK